ncbi:MAG: hypothetical protein ACLVGL_17880, partial [Waltera sp.]
LRTLRLIRFCFFLTCSTSSPNRWSDKVLPWEMTVEEIQEFITAFRTAKFIKADAGVDGVEIRRKHEGYLLTSLL